MVSVDSALWSGSLDGASRLLKYTLSTIQSPGFSQVRLIYKQRDFHAGQTLQRFSGFYQPECYGPEPRGGTSWYRRRFEVFREAHGVRDFELVLVVYTLENSSEDMVGKEDVVGMLKEDVAEEKLRGGFNDLFPEPSAIFIPTGLRSHR